MNPEPSTPEPFIDIRISIDIDSDGLPTLGLGEVSGTSLDSAALVRLSDELDPNAAFAAIFGGINAFLDIPEGTQTSEDIASDI